MEQINFIPLANLMLGFLPVIILIAVMRLWGLSISNSIYANIRMLIQLLLIGYVLTFIFETDQPIIIGFVVFFMIFMSAWIAMRPLKEKRNISFYSYFSVTCIEWVGGSYFDQSIHSGFTKMV